MNHGYVKLIESWGSDERIIEAARMSTNKGFLGWGTPEKPGDEKLLAYLWKNKHATPFEMAGATMEIQAPILVFREWHRHRTQCLAGDTKICCVTPTGVTFTRTIKEIFDLKYGGVIDNAPARHKNGKSKTGGQAYCTARRRKHPWRVRVLPNCQNRMLRVLDEATGLFHVSRMAECWEAGVKPVFKVTAGKFSVVASAEHPFLTKRGWVKVKRLRTGDFIARLGVVANRERPIPESLRSAIGFWTSRMRCRLLPPGPEVPCYVCKTKFPVDDLELDHVVPVLADLKLALDETNLKPACKACHRAKTNLEQPCREGTTRRGVRWARVDKLPEPAGEVMTYDLEVEGEHHNYVANDMVVHNSYSELSARYTQMPDLHYLPELSRIQAQSKNKQGSEGELAPGIAEEFLRRAEEDQKRVYENYQWALDQGISREIARLNTPVSRYSRMRASANLRNWLGFLTLRMASNAQLEIRECANQVGEIIADKFPRTWALFRG